MIEDKLRKLRYLYYASPQWMKTSIGSAYAVLPISLRLGSEYIRFQKTLEESQEWSSQQMLDYQYQELKKTITSAYNKVPYYREKFNQFGVNPSQLKSLDDISIFPTLRKRDIKENYEKLINPEIASALHLTTTTGGSTAEPIRFLHVKGLTRSKEKAFIYHGWSRAGYKPGMKAIQLKGRPVGIPEKNIFWEYEPIQNILEMDSNYLSNDNIPFYINAIKRFKAKFIIAFPSSIYLIAKYIRQHQVEFPRFEAIFLVSENVYEWQRQTLQEIFQCRIFSHYGHSEMVLLGMEGEKTNELLFFPEYGFMEVLDEQGQRLNKVYDKGQLVGTSFHNYLMPLIRYKTQDIGIVGQPHADAITYPILKDVEGRLQEFIVTKNQRLISICTMGAAHFDVLDSVYETQYYQDQPGEIIFNIVPKNNFTPDDKALIEKVISEKTGPDVTVKVKKVTNIQRTRNGKHMMIVQKLPLNILEKSQGLDDSEC